MQTESNVERIEVITVWVPALKRGAPSNASGMSGSGQAYATRKEALAHEHWNNQAPWATARSVTIADRPLGYDDDADHVCGTILGFVDTFGAETEDEQRAADLIRQGKRVEGVRLWLRAMRPRED